MIRTFGILLDLQLKHIEYMREAYEVDAFDTSKNFGRAFEGVTVTATRNRFTRVLHVNMTVDVPKMLNKGDITASDFLIVELKLKEIIDTLYGDDNLYYHHRLTRIDYRYDAVVEDQTIRQVYIDLFKKSYRKKARRLKEMGRINLQGEFEEYGTGLEHVNGSVETAIYDKMSERIEKKKPIKDYERDVLRFEVRLKKDFLAYQKREYDAERKLETYFTNDKYKKMMEKFILETYLVSDFHKYSQALEKIEKSHYSIRRKKSIENFLGIVTRGDLSSPQKSMSPATFKNRLTECNELGFHPITIPNTWKHVADCLGNPLAPLCKKINEE
ncbi:hypothetical protein CSV69_15765 [Sporosarcina sp. P26b]|uniref:hypothetical protein n=1 Tax=Sporosarcina sp. P26b TaxID=2048253 RepID=UPI000C16C82A|nr:hypothetical protein [Sporosarcina sp. P26b]PIC94620.1 hypothetical protein CSV69_15765 [Sporosarcina sp. P26b]